MTPKQFKLLSFIQNYNTTHGYPPNFEEMKNFMSLKSKSGIHRLLKELEDQNILKRNRYQSRGMSLENNEITNDNCTNIPFCGKIAAGMPIEAVLNENEKISVPNNMVGNGNYYALTVEGDSMIGLGIMNGDTVIIKHTQNAENGQIVVALVDEYEVTLKKFHKKGHSIALEPANPEYQTRIFSEERIKIQGVLAGLMRQYNERGYA